MRFGAAYLIGMVWGSFGNVLIARVPDDLSIGGRSRCPHCGTQLKKRDLIPVLSWLMLGGHCRDCRGPISYRYPAVELLTATLFYITVQRDLDMSQVIAWLIFTGLAVPLAVIDFKYYRLPDRIVFSMMALGLIIFTVSSIHTGEWDSLFRGITAALVTSTFFLLIRIFSRGGMGLGDVKLALVTGLYLGYESWHAVIFGTLTAFVIGAVAGLFLILAKGADRKTRVPFGPFMLLGAWVSYWVTPLMIETLKAS